MPRRTAALLPTNLALLQNQIRRDNGAYVEEFKLQHKHFESLRDIFYANPRSAGGHKEFIDLIDFITHVADQYPERTHEFPGELAGLLTENFDALDSELAEKIVQSLILLRNKEIITPEFYLQTVFPVMVKTESKQLRSQAYASVIQLVKVVNHGAKNNKINKMAQALLFNLLENAESNGLWAPKIIRELWRRGVWSDARSVEIMSQAAVHPDVKVTTAGIRFFLGADQERDDAMNDNDSDDDQLDMATLRHKLKVNKKSGKRGKQLEQVAKSVKKKQNGPGKDATHLNFSAIHLLRDPQGFADKLYSTHLAPKSGPSSGSGRLSMEQKILCVNLVSRLIGVHKLTILGFYSFLMKYLTPKQKDATQFMAAAAQASHDLIPPEVLSPVIRKIADEFVSDGVAAEVAAAGLNTIREILARAPLSIDETLLHDLIQYRGSKAKPVVTAARGLISLFRDIMPSMLPSKERGKQATMAVRSGEAPTLKYGEAAPQGIQGLDLLSQWKAANAADDDNEGNDGWEIDSDDNEDMSDEGWVTMVSDEEYAVSDSDDEKDSAAKETPQTKKTESEVFAEFASKDILTPADFAKMDELKLEAGVRKAMGQSNEEIVDAFKLTGPNKYKQDKEERLAHVREGREGREFGSRKRKHAEKEHSTTNREKARKKNFIMMIHKRDVQGKAKKSLRDKQKVLRAHIKRQKMKK